MSEDKKDKIADLKQKVILSLGEWKELVTDNPKLIRNAPEYILDALEYWGVEKYQKFGKTIMRFKSLTLSEKSDERLIGHEMIQTRLYQSLKTLCRNNSKMILLVGPNGSAKSTLWSALSYALEQYSKTDEGARYVIEWVFPYHQTLSKPMGFSELIDETEKEETFAFMDDEKIERLKDDISSNPALLFTPEARKNHFQENKSKLLKNEELSIRSYKIIKELQEFYKTKKNVLTIDDPEEILKLISRHIRIKKVEISKVYQEGIAVIDPNTDPRTMSYGGDQSTYYMKKAGPEVLKNIMDTLPELRGPLSKASNGLLIMEDSLESILSFISQFLNEKRKINVNGERYKIDLMLVGSVNPEKLEIIKENPEFNRFMSRLDIVYVPYLLEYSKEAQIYKIKIDDLRQEYHIAPYTEELFALFSVMTRLRTIMSNKNYEKEYLDNKKLKKVKDKLKDLSLLQKAKMYDSNEMPTKTISGDNISPNDQEIISDNMDIIFNEWSSEEGRGYGISYREVDAIIDRALIASHNDFLSPISLMKELKNIIKNEIQDYSFLQAKSNVFEDKSYIRLIDYLEEEYLNIINQEMRDIFDLNFKDQIISSLESYIMSGLKVVIGQKGKILDKNNLDITKTFLESRENICFGKSLDEKERQNNWFKYAGDADASLSLKENVINIFEAQIKAAQNRIYKEKRAELSSNLNDVLALLEKSKLENRTQKEIDKIKSNVDKMYKKGYNNNSAKELIAYLQRNIDKLNEKQ